MKAAREKKVLNLEKKMDQVHSRLSTEPWQARKEFQYIFNMLNRKNMQPIILYPARLLFEIGGEIKCFPGKQKQKEFMTSKPALQEILRETV